MPRAGVVLVTLLIAALPLVRARAQSTPSTITFPHADWERIERPEAIGYDRARLAVLRDWLKTGNTKAMFVAVEGKVLFEYGDVAATRKVASVRKSILAMLYGKYVASGVVDLDKKVTELGLADVQPFLKIEENATLRHLLTARSGIYLPAGNQELSSVSPTRGSQSPGTYFQYQNWDFNAAGTAFERLTGKDIFEALETDLARPIGMQDFDRARQKKVSAMPESRHPEYAMYLSARDLARVGLLMLAHCNWQGRQLIPKDWCQSITTLVTASADIHPSELGAPTWPHRWGYGMLWWVWDAPNIPGTVTGFYQGAYTAMGAYGQYITVLPVLDMVIAHTVDFEEFERRGERVPQVYAMEYDAIVNMLVAALKIP